jgi:RimJ/RimL family protein N-acetyltransferase
MIPGERVRLRAFEIADAETVWQWYQDHEFSVLDGNIYGASLETIRTFVQSMASPSYADASFGIETEEGVLIGLIRLKRGAPEDRHADFGIAIERAHWNRGYGTDATRTILRFAFEEMNLHRVSLGVLDYNTRAQRCYEKCGFRAEGRERQARFRNGHWCDRILMGILRDEFVAPNQDQVSPG